LSEPTRVGVIYSHVRREGFPSEAQYIPERDAKQDAQIIGEYLGHLGWMCAFIPEMKNLPNAPDMDDRWLRLTIEMVVAGAGTEEDGRWYYEAIDNAKIVQANDEASFTATSSYPLYLTFAKKLISKRA
jgi:hypothetical protein